MSHFYHVTAQKPTAVISTCTGHFTGKDTLNLLVCKNTFIEVFEVAAEGLKLIKDIPINGKIVAISLFRRKGKELDSLFILTHKADAAIIECRRSHDTIEFPTIACGSIEDRAARLLDQGFEVLVDPDASVIVIRFYQGIFKVILLSSLEHKVAASESGDGTTSTLATYNLRVEENSIVDMAFLYGYSAPTFAIIYEEAFVLHMKSYELTLKQLGLTPSSVNSIEPDSKLLIPVPRPYGGVLVVGDNTICYYFTETTHISQAIPQAMSRQMLCYTRVDAQRYLIGDMAGRLYMVELVTDGGGAGSVGSASTSSGAGTASVGGRVTGITVVFLGETAIPESITYLDNGHVFVGSTLGDSQLIRLSAEADPGCHTYVTVLESFTNIGPVVDMVMQETNGQNQLIAASGAFKEGGLKVIRNGIGIHERASVDHDMMKRIWCFPFGSDDLDDAVVISLVLETHLCKLVGDDIAQHTLPGLETGAQTIYCAMPRRGQLLQATMGSMRLVGVDGSGILAEWQPPTGRAVSCVNSFGPQVVAASGAVLYYLFVEPEGKFKVVAEITLDQEVACIDLTPFTSPTSPSPDTAATTAAPLGGPTSRMVAVGLWIEHTVVLLTLPDLRTIYKEKLGTSVLPRSILIAQLDEVPYIFVAIGDGTVFYFVIDVGAGTLRDCKKVNAGTGPSMVLRLWQSQGKTSVFICSNHPCIVFPANNKLVFANVNLKEVTHMCPLNSEHYRDCLSIVSPTGLLFGSVDNIQKLHVRTVLMEETPRRLALQEETGTLAVITFRNETYQDGTGFRPQRSSISQLSKISKSSSQAPKIQPTGTGIVQRKLRDIEVSTLLILDSSSLEVLHAHTFHYSQVIVEMALSVTSLRLTSKSGTAEGTSSVGGAAGPVVFVVGTAFILEEEVEPSKGRIHLLRWDPDGNKLETLLVHDVSGAVYKVLDFNGRLLTSIGSIVRLFEYKDKQLSNECYYADNVMALYLKRKDDFVLVGDLMRSVTLLLYKPNMNSFEVVGRHRSPRWTTAVEIMDDDHFLASESDFNLYVVSRDGEQTGSGAPTVSSTAVPADGSTSVAGAMATAGIDEKRRLGDCAFVHIGDFVNTFVHGNLVMQNMNERSLAVTNPILYGSVQGTLGLICHLSPALYRFLKEVETCLSSLVKPVGQFQHDGWRAYKSMKSVRMAENFVDGDLIELFLDLSLADMERVVDGLKIPTDLSSSGAGIAAGMETEWRPCQVDDLIKVIEELSRLH